MTSRIAQRGCCASGYWEKRTGRARLQKGQVAYGWRDMPVPHAYPVKKEALAAKVRLGLEVAAPNLEIL